VSNNYQIKFPEYQEKNEKPPGFFKWLLSFFIIIGLLFSAFFIVKFFAWSTLNRSEDRRELFQSLLRPEINEKLSASLAWRAQIDKGDREFYFEPSEKKIMMAELERLYASSALNDYDVQNDLFSSHVVYSVAFFEKSETIYPEKFCNKVFSHQEKDEWEHSFSQCLISRFKGNFKKNNVVELEELILKISEKGLQKRNILYYVLASFDVSNDGKWLSFINERIAVESEEALLWNLKLALLNHYVDNAVFEKLVVDLWARVEGLSRENVELSQFKAESIVKVVRKRKYSRVFFKKYLTEKALTKKHPIHLKKIIKILK